MPINASDTGITIISFNEKPPLFEETTITIKIEEIIVVGIECFLIPKYRGMRDIPEAAIAFIKTGEICCLIIEAVNVSGIN